jgi:hypothetical protein
MAAGIVPLCKLVAPPLALTLSLLASVAAATEPVAVVPRPVAVVPQPVAVVPGAAVPVDSAPKAPAPARARRPFLQLGGAAKLGFLLADYQDGGAVGEANFVLRLNPTRVFSLDFSGGPFFYSYGADPREEGLSGASHRGAGLVVQPRVQFNLGSMMMLRGGPVLGVATDKVTKPDCTHKGVGPALGASIEPAVRLSSVFELGAQVALVTMPQTYCYDSRNSNSGYSSYSNTTKQVDYLSSGLRAAMLW